MTKRAIIFFSSIIIALIVLYVHINYQVIIMDNEHGVVYWPDEKKYKYFHLEVFDFSNGDNVAYLLFSREDIKHLPKEMHRCNLFECRDNTILEDLQNAFLFIRSDGDMTTCESEILVYKDGKLIFRSGFVLTENTIGIQNSIVGWAYPFYNDELKKILLKFKPSNNLIIKL